MKMLVVTSIKEDLHHVSKVMEAAQIKVFSVSDTIGHKNEHDGYLLNNWFARSEAATNALFFFSFTDDDKACIAMQLIKEYNAENPSKDGVIKVQMNLNDKKTILFKLTDISGRVLLMKQVDAVKGTNDITLQEGNIHGGNYYLQAVGVEGVRQIKIE